jgi:hypothetical protein
VSSGHDWLEGGCHCGAVRFRVRPGGRKVLDCNCSICRKKGFLHLIVPPQDFQLLQGADALREYRFGTGVARHRFCGTCGVHPFYTPRSHPDQVDVNVRCLDGDAMDLFEPEPFDGQRWQENVDRIR